MGPCSVPGGFNVCNCPSEWFKVLWKLTDSGKRTPHQMHKEGGTFSSEQGSEGAEGKRGCVGISFWGVSSVYGLLSIHGCY